MSESSINKYSTSEIQASQFYIHKSYVNTYYYVYKFLENWIADNIFRQDNSRVFLASDDYAFRRRFELTDTSKDYSTLEFSSLQLPFSNYWPQNNGWIVDPRIAAKSAALTYLGIYEGNTKVKAAQSLFTIPTTFWFDREDDARFAYDCIYFNSYNEHYYSINVPYGRDDTIDNSNTSGRSAILQIPMNLQIENLQFNPQFKESDWLKKQRVFTIKVDFRIRSYAILPPDQPKYTISMNSDGILSDGSRYEDGFNYYYVVDDVITNLNNGKNITKTYDAGYNYKTGSYVGSTPFPDEGEDNIIYVDSYIKEKSNNKLLNLYKWDYVNNTYTPLDASLDSMSIRYNEFWKNGEIDITRFDCVNGATKTTNTLTWEYGENTSPEDIKSISLHLASRTDAIYIDPLSKSYKITGLKSNSQYYGYIIFEDNKGESKKFIVNFVTEKSKSDEETIKGSNNSIVDVPSNEKKESVIGFSW